MWRITRIPWVGAQLAHEVLHPVEPAVGGGHTGLHAVVVVVPAIAEELGAQARLVDGAGLVFRPGRGVLLGDQLLQGQAEEGGHLDVKGLVHERAHHVEEQDGTAGHGENGSGPR